MHPSLLSIETHLSEREPTVRFCEVMTYPHFHLLASHAGMRKVPQIPTQCKTKESFSKQACLRGEAAEQIVELQSLMSSDIIVQSTIEITNHVAKHSPSHIARGSGAHSEELQFIGPQWNSKGVATSLHMKGSDVCCRPYSGQWSWLETQYLEGISKEISAVVYDSVDDSFRISDTTLF